MFKIIEISRRLCIPCKYFDQNADHNQVVVLALNSFMYNKVIHGAGLFILLVGIETVEVLPTIMNKSDIFLNIRFQCLVFSMVEGETLLGTITECTPQGLSINLKFFKSIFVDSHYLPTPSKFDGKCWIWFNKIGIDEYYFTMKVNDEVRFKIIEIKYNRFNVKNNDKAIEPVICYATFKQDDLGPVLWWS